MSCQQAIRHLHGGMQDAVDYRSVYGNIVAALLVACREHYGENLTALALFGSVARDRFRPDSDIDVLVVLREGRPGMRRDFQAIDVRLEPHLQRAHELGAYPVISPVIKTQEAVTYGSPLFLDMTLPTGRRILFDRDGFLEQRLLQMAARMQELGSVRIEKGGGYYWLLKPDYRPGDTIQL